MASPPKNLATSLAARFALSTPPPASRWGRWRAACPARPKLLEVRQYQVVHDPDGLHVAVALRDSAPPDIPARVKDALARELRDAGAVPPPIEVTVVPEIDRDPGHGAKFKLIKSTVGRP